MVTDLASLILSNLSGVFKLTNGILFCRSLRRHGQTLEKVNRGMILAPLVGIILNLLDGSEEAECRAQHDVVGVFSSMDCLNTIHCGFQCLLEYSWVSCHFYSLTGRMHMLNVHALEEPNFLLHFMLNVCTFNSTFAL